MGNHRFAYSDNKMALENQESKLSACSGVSRISVRIFRYCNIRVIYKVMEAKELSHRIYDIVVHEVDAMYPQFIKRVNDIDIDYFEDITRDSEEMPEELNFELRDIVLDDIRLYAVQLLDRSGIKERIGEVLGGVGPIERKEILEQAKKDLRSYVYASSVLNGSSDISEEKLQRYTSRSCCIY